MPNPPERCFVKYCHGRWHLLSAVGRVWWLKAFSFIELSNNHLNGFHIFDCVRDTPTSVLARARRKEFWEFLPLQTLCFFSPFFEVAEMAAGLQTGFYSVTHCFGEKIAFPQVTAEATLSFYRDVLV